MIYVSDAWKNAHKQMILPESFVEITMSSLDDSVTGTVSGVNADQSSNLSSVINNADTDYHQKQALLEHNLWTLDGSTDVIDNCNNVYLTKNDTLGGLTITLSQVNNNSIPGFTIIWSSEHGNYASKFSVTVKNGATVVATTTVTNNTSNESLIEMPVSGYNSVTITILEWSHPDQRNRIDSVMFGHRIVFTKDDIISYSHEQSGSPLGTELSKNSIEFELDNSDGRWNPMNPSGLAKYLYERQKLTVRYGMQTVSGLEWIPAGVFYLTEWKAPSNGLTASFAARDAIEFMLNTTYSRPYVDGVTVGEGRVHVGRDDAVYKNSDHNLVTILPVGTPVRVYEKSVWYPEGFGNNPEDPGVMFYRIDQGWLWGDSVSITSDMMLTTDLVAAMEKCLPEDVGWTIDGEGWFGVYAPTAIEEEPIAEFVQKSIAAYGLTISQGPYGTLFGYSPTTGAILQDYTISADVSYLHPEIELTKPLKSVSIVQHYDFSSASKTVVYNVAPSGEDVTIDCPYMWHYETDRLNLLADRHINWWKHREVVSGEFRADPRLQLFDVVNVETKYGMLSSVMITYIKYTYNGSFRGTYEGKVVDAYVEEV